MDGHRRYQDGGDPFLPICRGEREGFQYDTIWSRLASQESGLVISTVYLDFGFNPLKSSCAASAVCYVRAERDERLCRLFADSSVQ